MLDRLDRPIRVVIFGLVLAVVVSSLLSTHAHAAGPALFVEIGVESERVSVDEQGRRAVERVPVRQTRPGEVLVYTLAAINRGDGPALGARIEDPVPDGTVLLLESLEGASTPSEASVDGGRSWSRFPVWIERRDAAGAVRRVPAPAESYTHLRWVIDGALGPGERHGVSFKVRVQ